jgi:hypothetical protein
VVIVLGLAGVAFVLLGGDDDDEASTSSSTTPGTETPETTDEDTTTTTEEEPDDTTTTTEDDDPPDTVEPEDVSVFDIEVGDCWNDPSSESTQTETLPVVPCDQPHDKEVIFLFDLTGDEFDQAAVEPAVEAECVPAFEEFVGTDYQTSELYLHYISPTSESWEAGDREVICSIYDGTNNEPLVGSMEGAEI